MQLDQPISDKEFNDLDKFLLSDKCPDDAMTMDSLHGYLTAIAVGPEVIPISEWLPHVWGDDSEKGPQFKNEKEFERVVNLIVRFMNEIVITLEVAPKEFEPLYCEHESEGKSLIDGEAWAWGFQPTGTAATSASPTVCRATPTVGTTKRVVDISATGRPVVTRSTATACPTM